jgi:hypothetical protein
MKSAKLRYRLVSSTDFDAVGDNDIVPLNFTWRLYLRISLCLLGVASLTAQVAPHMGAWRQSNLTWKKPPAELQLKERYAEAAILYFSPDQRFVLLYGTVIQGSTSEAISGGDGRIVYVGTWKLTSNSLHVEYRLVSRTVAKEGETLPGPVRSEDVRVRGSTLLFQKDRYTRDEKLDGDDEFKIILERESARQREHQTSTRIHDSSNSK